jgi:hypothetical protein
LSKQFSFDTLHRNQLMHTVVCKERKMKTRYPIGTTATTGQICPESGVWQVVGVPTTTAPIAKGNKMPPYANKAVTWKLIQYA